MNARLRLATEQGNTLMEIVAASVPLALIGLLLFSAFGFTVAFSRRGGVQVEAIQQARIALHLLARELHESSAAPDAIIIWSRNAGAARDGVGFLTARVDGPRRSFLTDSAGTPHWQQAVYYLHDGASGELRRFTGEPRAPASPQAWAKGRFLAGRVRRLHVERRNDLVIINLTVGVPLREAVLETAVRPRN